MASPADTHNQISSYTIMLNNSELSSEYQLAAIETTKEVNKISRARFAIMGGNPKMHEFEEGENAIFQPGKDVEIKLGFNQLNSTVFKGIVEKIEIKMDEGYIIDKVRSLLIVNCVDKAIELKNSNSIFIYKIFMPRFKNPGS